MKGGFGGAAVQCFFGGDARDVGIVVFFGDVREDEIANVGIEAVGIGEVFADGVIRKMSGAGEHPLLDDPRVGADLEHVQIVIGFEDHAVGAAKMHFDEFGHVAEVGADRDFYAVASKGEADGIGGIVGDDKSVDIDVADGEMLAGFNFFYATQALGESDGEGAMEGIERRFGDVQRSFPKVEDLGETNAVIGMLVGDEHGVQMIEIAFDGSEARESFAFTETGVDKDAGAICFEQGEIARTSGGQDGDAQADGGKAPS